MTCTAHAGARPGGFALDATRGGATFLKHQLSPDPVTPAIKHSRIALGVDLSQK
jgi:hypothetical protein